MNFIQRQFQALNPQIGFNVNWIQCEFDSKTDSTQTYHWDSTSIPIKD